MINPDSNPDHADPASWRSSVEPGGSPGAGDADRFSSWAARFNLSPDAGDLDQDGDQLSLFREYAQGGSPASALPGEGLFEVTCEELLIDGVMVPHLLLSVVRNLAADDVVYRIERNVESLTGEWQNVTNEFTLHSDEPLDNGRAILRYRRPLPEEPYRYWRMRFLTE